MAAKKRRSTSLQEFIPKVVPGHSQPKHLTPLTNFFERIVAGEKDITEAHHYAPGAGKTDAIGCGFAYLWRHDPSIKVCYVSYGQALTEKKSRRFRAIAERARVKIDPNANALHDWRVVGPGEGGFWGTSVGGPLVGERFDVIAIDDALRSRAAAESAREREKIYEYVVELIGRGEPGVSLLYCAHRWHQRDPAAMLIEQDGWREVTVPAIDAEGRSYWPERWSIERLRMIQQRIGPYAWASLYQGSPMSRGGSVFDGDTVFFDYLPASLRIFIGLDLNYVAKTRGDFSAAVVLGLDDAGNFYVIEVIRKQTKAPDFAAVLVGLQAKYPGATFASYVSGTERGTLDFFERAGVKVTAMTAREDKFSRSQSTAASWIAGKIRLPREAPWLDAFVDEIMSFTGTGDLHDDQVDALVSAHDVTHQGSGGFARWSAAIAGMNAHGGVNALRAGFGPLDVYGADELQALASWSWRRGNR